METGTGASRYHLVLFQGGSDGVDRRFVGHVRRLLDEHLSTEPFGTEIDLWVDSPGGDPHATYKLFLELRHRCQKLRAVIPDYAKSAATLLMLGVDEIYMSPSAELGPLDAQIVHPDKEREIVSALDIADSLDSLAETSFLMAQRYTNFLVEILDLPRSEVLGSVLEYMAQFMQPIVSKLDPHRLHRAKSLLQVASQYGVRMLACRNVSDHLRLPPREAESLVNRLVKDYSAHAFIISRDESKKLGLPVHSAENHPRWANIKKRHDDFEKSSASVVEVLRDSDLGSVALSPETNHDGKPGTTQCATSDERIDRAHEVEGQGSDRDPQPLASGGTGRRPDRSYSRARNRPRQRAPASRMKCAGDWGSLADVSPDSLCVSLCSGKCRFLAIRTTPRIVGRTGELASDARFSC